MNIEYRQQGIEDYQVFNWEAYQGVVYKPINSKYWVHNGDAGEAKFKTRSAAAVALVEGNRIK